MFECKREMMVYGMDKLNGMEESHLDEMSPFQKNSDAIRKYFNVFILGSCESHLTHE